MTILADKVHDQASWPSCCNYAAGVDYNNQIACSATNINGIITVRGLARIEGGAEWHVQNFELTTPTNWVTRSQY